MATIAETDVYISFAKARRRLGGVAWTTLRQLIDGGRLSVREIPGARPKVLLADVEAVLSSSTRLATVRPVVTSLSSDGADLTPSTDPNYRPLESRATGRADLRAPTGVHAGSGGPRRMGDRDKGVTS